VFGAGHQLDQKDDEATWHACVRASLDEHGGADRLLVYSETFVDNPAAFARRVADFSPASEPCSNVAEQPATLRRLL
jgi:hypothetical protein